MFKVTCWKRAKRGFTLAEVIVSLMILSSIMLFFYQVYYAGNKATLSNKQKLDALFIAENKIESYRSSPQGV
ncbi:MAG TPA: type II secretion system protein, partial [Clostridia bacterium]